MGIVNFKNKPYQPYKRHQPFRDSKKKSATHTLGVTDYGCLAQKSRVEFGQKQSLPAKSNPRVPLFEFDYRV